MSSRKLASRGKLNAAAATDVHGGGSDGWSPAPPPAGGAMSRPRTASSPDGTTKHSVRRHGPVTDLRWIDSSTGSNGELSRIPPSASQSGVSPVAQSGHTRRSRSSDVSLTGENATGKEADARPAVASGSSPARSLTGGQSCNSYPSPART